MISENISSSNIVMDAKYNIHVNFKMGWGGGFQWGEEIGSGMELGEGDCSIVVKAIFGRMEWMRFAGRFGPSE